MKVLPLVPSKNDPRTQWLVNMFNRRFHAGKPDEAIFSQYDLGVAFLYPHVLNRKHLRAFSMGVINIHPSYLPFGRGAMPNVWTIVDHVPGGITIHWMDEGIDTGNIIAQYEMDPEDWDTGETYYKRLVEAAPGFFKRHWKEWGGDIPEGFPQDNLLETVAVPSRKTKDVHTIDDLESYFNPSEIWDILDVLRARTYQGHESAYVRDRKDGKKIFVRVSLEKES